MAKEPYLITSLPFDNSVTYDECGLKYITVGNPSIANTSNLVDSRGNKLFKTALYCNGNSNLKVNPSYTLGGQDLTVTCWFYMLEDSDKNKWNTLFCIFVTDYSNRIAVYHSYGKTNWIMSSVKSSIDQYFEIKYNTWFNIAYCYIHKSGTWYTYLDGKLVETKLNAPKNRASFTGLIGHGCHDGEPSWYGYIKHFKIYDGIAKWTTSSFDLKETYNQNDQIDAKFDTKRIIYRLYNISYDSLYNYNINDYSLYDDTSRNIYNNVLYNNDTYRDINKINEYNNNIYRNILRNYVYNNNIYRSILKDYIYNNDTLRDIHKINNYNNDTYRDINKLNTYNNDILRDIKRNYIYNNDIYRSILRNYIYNNDTYRDIHKINNYNNNTLRNVLYNINPLYDTYRYIKRINKSLYDTKRNIKHDYMDILYNTKRLIHNNINIINYIYRKKICNGNNTSDTVRSVISWKHKIVAFITNPQYRLI